MMRLFTNPSLFMYINQERCYFMVSPKFDRNIRLLNTFIKIMQKMTRNIPLKLNQS